MGIKSILLVLVTVPEQPSTRPPAGPGFAGRALRNRLARPDPQIGVHGLAPCPPPIPPPTPRSPTDHKAHRGGSG